MFTGLAQRVFGSANERFIKRLAKDVAAINALEPKMQALSDEALKGETDRLRQLLVEGKELDQLLPEAFAIVREAAVRTLGQRHFDVQLMGGMVLHQGKISEMKTGEGKTLVATLAVYLNALEGKGVHVVTVNDYLAKRDSEWMGQIYKFLGLSVGVITQGMNDPERRQAYHCDITYGTNSEMGFDYLRDNMKFRLEDMVQRPFNFAIVDEVDSILIDEARTPLIISGPTEDNSELYNNVDRLIPHLVEADYEKDEKSRHVTLTEQGTEHIEKLLRAAGLLRQGGLYDVGNVSLVHHVDQALRAHKLFTRDVDYIVNDNKVILIDEFTGRMMAGRRFSEGLHQALEAKEQVEVQNENQTLASITYQNFFRLFPKLAGMTGTAMTEAPEFSDIYGLDVVEIPTHVPVKRLDHDDEIYRTAAEKYQAIVQLIKERQEQKQPILGGTVSIEKSELLSGLLKKNGIPHQVLNARYHEQEAYIIAEAGVPGAVTIATNMAGRGTDIQLGGNLQMRLQKELASITDEATRTRKEAEIITDVAAKKEIAIKAGGLFVIGTERHESRRIDNQLRGRSGRQGDPGASRFFLSLEDDLMRIFGGDRLDSWLKRLGLQEGEAITHPMMNKALQTAQQKVEARNFDIRKNLLKFDNVMNDQRKVIYEQRRDLMQTSDVSSEIQDMRQEVLNNLVDRYLPIKSFAEQWDTKGLHEEVLRIFGIDVPAVDWAKEEGIANEAMIERLTSAIETKMQEKEARFTPEIMRIAEKTLLLQILDQSWKEHLLALDHLRHGIGLRAYAQRDPLNEYKREAFEMFEAMLERIREQITLLLSHVELRQPDSADPEEASPPPSTAEPVAAALASLPDSSGNKPGRNEPCPCGSGKKYKHCHGRIS